MSMNLPIVDGAEFLRLKSTDKSIEAIPVIAMIDAGEAMPNGVIAILKRPIDMSELLSAVRKFILGGDDPTTDQA